MEKRVNVDINILKQTLAELKTMGYTVRKLNKEIGRAFSHAMYENRTIKLSELEKIEKIIGKKIDYTITTPNSYCHWKQFSYEKNTDLAEMVGVLLGDGQINHYSYPYCKSTRSAIHVL